MRLLNLGILAHVDAGKTSLTERLLHAAGVIDEIGSVDAGSTQTDSLALERRRGITIKAAVVSFELDGVTVNLLDTPGHPDFIAEVERVLDVLDGAVLVVSAVEGVQAQTRVLMRALHRLRIPTLLFVNKIDRTGARPDGVLADIRDRLTPATVPMGLTSAAGTKEAAFVPGLDGRAALEVLAEHDDALLPAYVDGSGAVPAALLRKELAGQTARCLAHPVYFGSAITGAGIPELSAGVAELLPSAGGDRDGPLSATVFKVDRGRSGEKVAYARLFSGTLAVRDRLGDGSTVTGAAVFSHGGAVPARTVHSGQIAKLWGLAGVRIGDALGVPQRRTAEHHFAPPTLETVVVPERPADRGALHAALTQLAEQDPLIGLRRDEARQELSVSLYGEVQKEVVQATLAEDHGIAVTFRRTTTLCVERPVATGAAYELIRTDSNPFLATVGIRVEPGPAGSGVAFRLGVELGSMPPAFFAAVEDTVHRTLRQGLHGWQVVDCLVTMTHSGYAPRQSHMHGSFDKSMSSTGADFRGLTPLVLMSALARAGTRVLEPVSRFLLDIPPDTLPAVTAALSKVDAVPLSSAVHPRTCVVEGEVPAARVHELRRLLPGLTRGEGVLEAAFAAYRPVRGPVPRRPRSDDNPLDRKEYLLHVLRRT